MMSPPGFEPGTPAFLSLKLMRETILLTKSANPQGFDESEKS